MQGFLISKKFFIKYPGCRGSQGIYLILDNNNMNYQGGFSKPVLTLSTLEIRFGLKVCNITFRSDVMSENELCCPTVGGVAEGEAEEGNSRHQKSQKNKIQKTN